MPTFIRKKTRVQPIVSKRRFVSADKPVSNPVKPARARDLSMSNDPTIASLSKKSQSALDKVNALLNDSNPESIDSTSTTDFTFSKVKVPNETNNAIFDDDELPPIADKVEFNGISSLSDVKSIVTEAVIAERKRVLEYQEKVSLLEKEKGEERRQLEKEIKNLKGELHRTSAISDNKFLSLSKELRTALKEIETIAMSEGIDPSTVNPPKQIVGGSSEPAPIFTPTPKEEPAKIIPSLVNLPAIDPANLPQPQPPSGEVVPFAPVPTEAKPTTGTLSKQKMTLTGGAIALLIIMLGIGIKFAVSPTKPNEALVKKYLAESNVVTDGSVAGASTTTPNSNPQADDPSQADVTFEQSVWESFKDPIFGINLEYPKNAVKPIRTESNVTFIRKTGYIFKVQRIETALTLDEYWKQIKATSLNYEVSTDKFKNRDSIKLKLLDVADYPGDRILVKDGSFIYDIWVARPATNFPEDEIKRAEKMLNSLIIGGGQ